MITGSKILSILVLSGLVLGAAVSDRDAQTPYGAPSNALREQRYDGQAVWRVDWSRLDKGVKEDVMSVIELLDLDVWHASPSAIDIRLAPHQMNVLRSYLPSSAFQPFIADVQSLIDEVSELEEEYSKWSASYETSASSLLKKKKKGGSGKGKGKKEKIDPFNLTTIETPFHDTYHPLEDLYRFGDTLLSTFEGAELAEGEKIDVKSFDVGNTYEGRAIRGWSAKINSGGNRSEPIASGSGRRGRDEVVDGQELEFIVQSGQHGREWVGPSSALYFLHSLILSAVDDPTSEAALLLRSFTFTVIPTINPDGLTYSRDHSRLWRKNRQEIGSKSCFGIDLNSNWGYKWRPSKATACSEAYAGKAAFEAYESKAVSEYLESASERGTKIRAFVDLHSYGQLFMFPFAHSCEDFPPDAEMLMEAGLGVAKAMRSKKGEGYEAGQACDLTYRAPGDAIDYSYGVTDVRWSYSAELRDTGTYGFLLPPKLIRATAEEASAGLQYLAKFIYTLEVAP